MAFPVTLSWLHDVVESKSELLSLVNPLDPSLPNRAAAAMPMTAYLRNSRS